MAPKIKTKTLLPQQEESERLMPEFLREPKTSTGFFRKPFFIASLIVVLALVALGYLAWQNQNLKQKLHSMESANNKTPIVTTNGSQKDLLGTVGKLIILPSNEDPTIATVEDLEKLKDQPFFVNARIGDKLLIYTTAQKAILYRPSENKIIELAPLSSASVSNSQATSSPVTVKQVLTLEIRNGSGKSGAASALKDKLAGQSSLQISKIGNAAKVYSSSVIVVLKPEALEAAKKIQSLVPAEILNALPAGEVAIQADVLLILGKGN